MNARLQGPLVPLILCGLVLPLCPRSSSAADPRAVLGAEHLPASTEYPLDLATVLRLAGARNIDVEIARERIAEAEANHAFALWQLLPTISAGGTYRAHDNLIQDVAGNMLDVHKQSYAVGPAISVQWEVGEAIFRNLAAKQFVRAAESGEDAQRQESMASAINAYLDLLRAQGEIGVSDLAIGISTNYAAQLGQAAAIGLAFKGDLHRVELQTMRHQLARRQALERAGSSAARLAQSLRLNPATTLHGKTSELIPIPLNSTNALDRLIAQALASRPELRQSSAGSAAARYANKQVVYGPLAPTLTAQAFVGGLGGDAAGIPHRFGESEDYLVGLGWKLGPGGLLDRSRIRFTEARVRTAALTEEKIRDEVIREVVEAHGRVQSLEDQLATAQHAAETAERVVQLTRQRKQFGVGAVLEDIQAQQELAQARLELVNAITEYNKAQYGLRRAIGALGQ